MMLISHLKAQSIGRARYFEPRNFFILNKKKEVARDILKIIKLACHYILCLMDLTPLFCISYH